jgi:hypothetical protein
MLLTVSKIIFYIYISISCLLVISVGAAYMSSILSGAIAMVVDWYLHVHEMFVS